MRVGPRKFVSYRRTCGALAVCLAFACGDGLAQQKKPGKEASKEPATKPCLPEYLAQPGEVAEWKGICQDGRPVGRGTLLWSKDGAPVRTFEGEVAAGQPYGKGSMEWADGRRYEGSFLEGVFSGAGVLTQASGERYEGNFAAGLADGQGVIHLPDGGRIEARFRAGAIDGVAMLHFGGEKKGDRFEGPLQDQQPHGSGIYHTAAGNRYVVAYRAGKLESQGEFTFASGDRYNGPIANNLPHGQGVLKKTSGEQLAGRFEAGVLNGRAIIHQPDGRRFEGEVRAGMPAGPGALFLPDGARWVGEFAAGKPSPEVRLWYPGGFVYTGAFDSRGPAGKGSLRLPDGETIEAEFAASIVAKGKARIAYLNGDRYDGTLENHLPNGDGVLETRRGNRYEGPFKDGRIDGTGSVKYASGLSYTGTLVAGVREGQGVLVWKDGSRYEGQFAGGLPNGIGTLVLAGGTKFSGGFADGLPSGDGRLDFASGRSYRGRVDAGLPTGGGVMTMPNRSRFEGVFANGIRQGQGALLMSNGDKAVLVFANDIPPKDDGPFFGIFKNKFEELAGLLDAGYYRWAQRYYLAKRPDFEEKMTQTEPLLKRLKEGLAEPIVWQENLYRLLAETALAESGRFATAADLDKAKTALGELDRLAAERQNIPLLANANAMTAGTPIELLRAERAAALNARLLSLLGQGGLDSAAELVDDAKRDSINLALPAAAQVMNQWLAVNAGRAAAQAGALASLVEHGLALDTARIVPAQQKIFDDLLLQGEFAAARQLIDAGDALKIDLLDRARAKVMASWIAARAVESGDAKLLLSGIELLRKRLGGVEDFRAAWESWLLGATAAGSPEEVAGALAAFEKQGLTLVQALQPRLEAALLRRLDAADPKAFLRLADIFAKAKLDLLPAFKDRLQFVRAGAQAKTPFPLTVKSEGGLRFNPLDEASPGRTTAATHVVLVDLHGRHLLRSFTKVEKLSSSISEGFSEYPNPEYARLEEQASALETQAAKEGGSSGLGNLPTNTGNRGRDNILGLVSLIASVSDAAGERKAAELRAQAQAVRSKLANTPRLLKKPKGVDYRYAAVAVDADRVLPATVYVIDLKRGSFVVRDLEMLNTESMETVLGLHPKDTQVKPGERLDRVRQLERKPLAVGLTELFAEGEWNDAEEKKGEAKVEAKAEAKTDAKAADSGNPKAGGHSGGKPVVALPLAKLADEFIARRDRRTAEVDKAVEAAQAAFEKQLQDMLSVFHEEGRLRAEPIVEALRTPAEPLPEAATGEARWVEQMAKRLQEPVIAAAPQ